MRLPFFNKYPYTTFEQLNLDWLMNTVGEWQSRIEALEAKVADHETRLTQAEEDIDSLEVRMEAAEEDISSLKGRMDTAESDIDALEGRMDTAENDIDALEGRMDTAESDIDALEGRMDTAEDDIDALEARMDVAEDDIDAIELKNQAQDNDISALDNRVTALEEEDEVIANPGGTGANLNTVSISGVTYVIPSGGGGGGSSVTPNPAGAATDTLEKIDVDGIIYDLPISSTEVTEITNNITNIQSDISDIEDNIEDNINVRLTGAASGGWPFEFTNDNTVQDILNANFTINEPGLYLFITEATFDTTNFGSTPRSLGAYIRRYHGNVPQDIGNNVALGKFHVNGNETSMITSAANINFSHILAITGTEIHDNYNSFKLSCRCNSSINRVYEGTYWISVIKLNGIDLDPYEP